MNIFPGPFFKLWHHQAAYAAACRIGFLQVLQHLCGGDNADRGLKSLEPAVLCPIPATGWPLDCALRSDAVKIRFKAGYSEVPKSIKQAMLLLIGHFYEHREAVNIGGGTVGGGEIKELPLAVSSLLRPFWVPRW
ncbi:head-tail connector protein [Thermoanaerobacterium sp. RBIITD]|uniref:head-tail connector protein n=1 Tax=Thermoanaerobacterium sp. RBIITD TaxID=1550240 RepID=UPI003313AFFC